MKKIEGVIGWLLLWVCFVPLASCSLGDDYDIGEAGTANLQISITAHEEDDLNTRAGSEVGTNSEYMHNLCILLVQDGVVKKKFLPDLANNEDARQGNLRTWLSEAFLLPAGNYTAYAFANIDTYVSTLWDELAQLAENESLQDLNTDINTIILADPAGTLDFAQNKFIPMSAKQQITVNAATKNISIGLDRLVSKIRIAVNPPKAIRSLTFSGYASQVKLFKDGTGTLDYNGEKAFSFTTGSISSIDDFYVNATEESGHPFSVQVTTNEYMGVTYRATTVRDVLPRNSIFPLTLQLDAYGLDLSVRCWLSPIGSYPVEVLLNENYRTLYRAVIPEGCQFEFAVSGIKRGAETFSPADLKCTWEIPSGITGIAFDNYTAGETTVKGHVTASMGKTFNLILKVEWTENEIPYNRIYTIQVVTDDMTNFPFKPTETRSTESASNFLSPEVLNMFKE